MQRFMILVAALAVGALSAQDMTDLDRDGLPDAWESHFGLATNSAVGDNGPYGDPDSDGLPNYAEFMAGYWEIGGNVYSNSAHAVPGLSPTNACSVVPGVFDAYVRPSGTNDCLRLLYTDGDFCDDAWELANPLASVDRYDDGRDTPYGNMWLHCRSDLSAGLKPVALDVEYYGHQARGFAGMLQVWLYKDAQMEGAPAYRSAFPIGADWLFGMRAQIEDPAALRRLSGTVYAIAWVDLDGNGAWNAGEPFGTGCDHPARSGFFGESSINLSLTDSDTRHLGRVELPPFGYATRVRIVRTGVDGQKRHTRVVLDKVVRAPRSWLNENDLRAQGEPALDWGLAYVDAGLDRTHLSYEVFLGETSTFTNGAVAFFTNTFDMVRAKAVNVYPSNETVHARSVQLRWRLPAGKELGYQHHDIQIADSGTNVVWARGTDMTRFEGLFHNGEFFYTPRHSFTNGSYIWRVIAMNAKFSDTGSQWSDWTSFTVADRPKSPPNAGSVGVRLFYSGKASSGSFFVSAHVDPAFRGLADSFVEVPFSAAATNMASGASATLTLLRPGKYYVVAWHDSNNNRLRDADEPWGYYNWLGAPGKVAFDPKSVMVPVSGQPPDVSVVIEDIPDDAIW